MPLINTLPMDVQVDTIAVNEVYTADYVGIDWGENLDEITFTLSSSNRDVIITSIDTLTFAFQYFGVGPGMATVTINAQHSTGNRVYTFNITVPVSTTDAEEGVPPVTNRNPVEMHLIDGQTITIDPMIWLGITNADNGRRAVLVLHGSQSGVSINNGELPILVGNVGQHNVHIVNKARGSRVFFTCGVFPAGATTPVLDADGNPRQVTFQFTFPFPLNATASWPYNTRDMPFPVAPGCELFIKLPGKFTDDFDSAIDSVVKFGPEDEQEAIEMEWDGTSIRIKALAPGRPKIRIKTTGDTSTDPVTPIRTFEFDVWVYRYDGSVPTVSAFTGDVAPEAAIYPSAFVDDPAPSDIPPPTQLYEDSNFKELIRFDGRVSHYRFLEQNIMELALVSDKLAMQERPNTLQYDPNDPDTKIFEFAGRWKDGIQLVFP